MINRNQKSNSLTKIAIYSALITAALMVINVSMSARVAKDGLAIDALSKQQAQLKGEIRDLEQQVITVTALSDLSVKAAMLGYQAPEKTVTISDTTPIAYNRN